MAFTPDVTFIVLPIFHAKGPLNFIIGAYHSRLGPFCLNGVYNRANLLYVSQKGVLLSRLWHLNSFRSIFVMRGTSSSCRFKRSRIGSSDKVIRTTILSRSVLL